MSIRQRHVSYSYETFLCVLTDINLHLNQRQKVPAVAFTF